jgi:hypothetical protein
MTELKPKKKKTPIWHFLAQERTTIKRKASNGKQTNRRMIILHKCGKGRA